MAVEFPSTIDVGYAYSQGTGSTYNDMTLSGLTAGRGIIVCVHGYNNGGSLAFTSCTMSGETVTAAGASTGGGSGYIHGRWYYIHTLATGGDRTLRVNYDGGTNANGIGLVGFEVTGHDTANMVPTTAFNSNNPSTITITTQYNNSAIVSLIKGGSVDGGTASGYTLFDCSNIQDYGRMFYKTDAGTAGSNNTTPSAGWNAAFTCEIKIVAGVISVNGSALTGGIGTQIPSMAIPL